MNAKPDWSIADADELYRISGWGAGYFRLNDSGKNAEIAMLDLIEGMEVRGKTMPVMLRVQNILENQIRLINESFAKAIADSNYRGKYRGVFPIKVNQQAQVIEDIVRFGKPWQHGLEAGSKAELMIALSMLSEPGPLIVCNGYKDREFVELGLGMTKLGFQVIFVIETLAGHGRAPSHRRACQTLLARLRSLERHQWRPLHVWPERLAACRRH